MCNDTDVGLLSYICGAIDVSLLTLRTLSDVDQAFDTVELEMLLKWLQISLGLSGPSCAG